MSNSEPCASVSGRGWDPSPDPSWEVRRRREVHFCPMLLLPPQFAKNLQPGLCRVPVPLLRTEQKKRAWNWGPVSAIQNLQGKAVQAMTNRRYWKAVISGRAHASQHSSSGSLAVREQLCGCKSFQSEVFSLPSDYSGLSGLGGLNSLQYVDVQAACLPIQKLEENPECNLEFFLFPSFPSPDRGTKGPGTVPVYWENSKHPWISSPSLYICQGEQLAGFYRARTHN